MDSLLFDRKSLFWLFWRSGRFPHFCSECFWLFLPPPLLLPPPPPFPNTNSPTGVPSYDETGPFLPLSVSQCAVDLGLFRLCHICDFIYWWNNAFQAYTHRLSYSNMLWPHQSNALINVVLGIIWWYTFETHKSSTFRINFDTFRLCLLQLSHTVSECP